MPGRPEYRLLVQSHKIASDKQRDEITVSPGVAIDKDGELISLLNSESRSAPASGAEHYVTIGFKDLTFLSFK